MLRLDSPVVLVKRVEEGAVDEGTEPDYRGRPDEELADEAGEGVADKLRGETEE